MLVCTEKSNTEFEVYEVLENGDFSANIGIGISEHKAWQDAAIFLYNKLVQFRKLIDLGIWQS